MQLCKGYTTSIKTNIKCTQNRRKIEWDMTRKSHERKWPMSALYEGAETKLSGSEFQVEIVWGTNECR